MLPRTKGKKHERGGEEGKREIKGRRGMGSSDTLMATPCR